MPFISYFLCLLHIYNYEENFKRAMSILFYVTYQQRFVNLPPLITGEEKSSMLVHFDFLFIFVLGKY